MNLQEVQEYYGKAYAASNKGDVTKALRLLDSLLTKCPTFTPGWNLRGSILEKAGASFDAALNFSQAIRIEPDFAAYHSNRGSSYLSMGEFEASLKDYDKAIKLDPDLAVAHRNKGNAYRRLVQQEKAVACYRNAVKLDPNDADAHLGLSMALLELQQFSEGWKEFEWRFRSGQMPARGLSQPGWAGERANGPNDILLIYGEQGYGDVLQFMRYAPMAKELWGGKIYLEVRLPMKRLADEAPGVDGVVVLGTKIPDRVTRQVAMMTVPGIVGTEKGFMGAYIKADPDLSANWAKNFAQLPNGIKVGLCWAGENREDQELASAIDARRSLALSAFTPAAQVKGIVWVSLQKGAPAVQIKSPPVGMSMADFMPLVYDFYDTAALIDQLDLVITVDTAVCHLAAAMGKPTWVLSRFDGCWRWFGARTDSPWYPSLRQFRQKSEGQWGPVMEEIWHSLVQFVGVKRRAA